MLNAALMFAFLVSSGISSTIDEPTYLYPENNRGDRIVGGYPVDITDHPFIGSLQRVTSTGSWHSCGCVLINQWFCLTAAHCTAGMAPSGLIIRFNSSFHATEGFLGRVIRIVNHPLYNPRTIDFDVAVLQLENPIDLDKYEGVDKIELAKQGEKFPDGHYTRTCGWGNTRNPNESSDRLRCVDVPLINHDVCVQAYAGRNVVTENMICAGYHGIGGKDACQGDSGGPLYTERPDGSIVNIGLVSWGIGCAEAAHPGVYTNVAAVRDWIDSQTSLERRENFDKL